MSDYRRGFGLEIGFIDHFTTRLVATFNYSAVADFYILQITAAHAKYFQFAVSSPVIPW
jgi:ethanolamine utilization microcompartment shell protein EutS